MSENGESTLWDFFEAKPLTDTQASIVWKGETLSQVTRQLKDSVPNLFWSSAREAIDGALHQTLSIPLSSILAGGWNQYRMLAQYRDRQKHPPEEVALVPLKQHKITSTHKPQIEILLNDRHVGSLEFDVVLALEIDMAILKIQNAKIWEIQVGSCRGKGTLKFGTAILFERPTKKLALPKLISIPNGLAI